MGTLRCRGEMGKVPVAARLHAAVCQWVPVPARQAWREPGPGLAERFTDLQF